MDTIYIENNITKTLDEVLRATQDERYKNFAPWIVIPGLTGSGKTASVEAWLEHNNLKNVYIHSANLTLIKETIKVQYFEGLSNAASNEGVQTFTKINEKQKEINTILSQSTIDSIDHETVVVIDDYDRSSEEVRKELYKYIRFHQLVDKRVNDEDCFRTINPLMLIVIIDTGHLITDAPLSEEELHLFGLDEYIKYIK